MQVSLGNEKSFGKRVKKTKRKLMYINKKKRLEQEKWYLTAGKMNERD